MEADDRELYDKSLDPGEVFGMLTDDSEDEKSLESRLQEQEDQLNKQFEEQRKKLEEEKYQLRRKVELKKKRKEEYIRLGGLKYENNPNKPRLPHCSIDPSISKSAPSYFIANLEASKKELTNKLQTKRAFLNTKVFTFGKPVTITPIQVNEKEYYTGIEICRRYLSQDTLTDLFSDIKILRLPKLFAKVPAPDFQAPDYPNWCVLGILYHKSDIKMVSHGSSRFITLGLTDFKFNVSVNIFDSGLIEKYNKLMIGDIIALLNPDIYVNKSTSTFSLKISHRYDCILEIGTARNFAICGEISKASGKRCFGYFDRSVDKMCEYHQEQKFSKTASKRMEFQTSVKMTAPTNRGGAIQKILYDSRQGRTILMDNENAPKTDRISKLAKRFSTVDAHQAYFQPGFVNEAALREKRERQQREREILQQKKDIMLRRKLERIKENKQKKGDLVENDIREFEEIRKKRENEKVDFGVSKFTLEQKREEQKKINELLKKIKKKESDMVPENEENKPFKRVPSQQVVLDFDSDDSDDNDTSFDKEREMEAFKRFKAMKK